MALGAFSELVASEYTTALVPFFLNISDPQKASLPEKYGIVTDDMIERAYEIFRSSIKENAELYAILETDIPGEYSTRSLQKDLDEDHAAWNEWMKARSKVLSSLSGDSRDIYERCTNNVKRGHLISLLNRYEESDIVSGGYYDILLKRDCTDKQLREYDFDSAYTEYMKRFR